MSKGGRPALDMLGQELRRGAEDYGPLNGTEQVAVFSHPDAPGRPHEGRKSLQDVIFGGGGELAPLEDNEALFTTVNWLPVTVGQEQQTGVLNTILTGVVMGARIQVSANFDLQGCFAHGHVPVNGKVNCYVANLTGDSKALAGGYLYVTAWNTDPEHPPGSEGHILLEDGGKILLE